MGLFEKISNFRAKISIAKKALRLENFKMGLFENINNFRAKSDSLLEIQFV